MISIGRKEIFKGGRTTHCPPQVRCWSNVAFRVTGQRSFPLSTAVMMMLQTSIDITMHICSFFIGIQPHRIVVNDIFTLHVFLLFFSVIWCPRTDTHRQSFFRVVQDRSLRINTVYFLPFVTIVQLHSNGVLLVVGIVYY